MIKKLILFSLILSLNYMSVAQRSDAFKTEMPVQAYLNPSGERTGEDYDVHFYFLDLELDNSSTYLTGTAQIDLTTSNSPSSIDLDLDNALSVSDVRLNGSSVSFTHSSDLLSIPLEKSNSRTAYSVEVDYSGTPPYGLYHGYYAVLAEEVTYSLSEPFDAMGWFPVKQDLTDKADSSRVYVTVPDNLMAGSNGLLTGTTDMGGGQTRYEWKSSYPIDYYLISVAVGNYQDYSFYAHPAESEDSILVQNYIYNHQSYLDYYEDDILATADMIEALSVLFGLYPHHEEKYGHCVVDLNGGMEHQTMTSLGNFSFNLVAHELGHSWFGNYITCATWQDIWINEGFAVYSEYLTYQELRSEAASRNWLEINESTARDYDDGSVYIPFDEATTVSRIFDYILTYKKGGMLVHMIRYLLDNDTMFFDVLHEHLSTHGDSVATGDDFKTILETTSGMDFDPFFNQWYYGEGYPIYDVTWYQAYDTVYINTIQTGSCPQAPLFTTPLEYRLYFSDGDSLTVRLPQNDLNVINKIPDDRSVTDIAFDPDLWIMKEYSIQQISAREAHSTERISIYPNPAEGHVQIHTPESGMYTVKIHTVQGKLLRSQTFNSKRLDLNLGDLSGGVYIMSLYDEKSLLKTEKLIIE
jgi:aminopeptidase N